MVLPLTNTNARIAGEVEWNVAHSQSCVWTSWPHLGVVPVMDDETTEIVAQLCTRIGMIMEDTSSIALMIGGLSQEERLAAIAELDVAADKISALTNAVRALTR